tara:strand:- start:4763 stop:7834 length:3072 start_codon:yes stop_codon:yes gene_type:complete
VKITPSSSYTHLSGQDAVAILESSYGIAGSVDFLPSERDQNFKVTTEEKDQFVLKIASPFEEERLVNFQDEVLNFLIEKKLPFSLPTPVPDKSGHNIVRFKNQSGQERLIRLVSYIEGKKLSEVAHKDGKLIRSLGESVASLHQTLTAFDQEIPERDGFAWDLTNASKVISANIDYIDNADHKRLLEKICRNLETEIQPILQELPSSLLHNDANDHNILVGPTSAEGRNVLGILDFGDMIYGPCIYDLAISSAYAQMGSNDPLSVITTLVQAYNEVQPLSETELEVLFPLICARLAVSVSLSARHLHENKNNTDPYLTVSQQAAWESLNSLGKIHSRLARDLLRDSCGYPPCPNNVKICDWLATHKADFGPLVKYPLSDCLVFDLSAESSSLPGLDILTDVDQVTKLLFDKMADSQSEVGIGRYAEPRLLYASNHYVKAEGDFPERRTIHLGLDLFLPAESPISAPLDGRVHSFNNNDINLDYGPTIILEHSSEEIRFFSLYGHLSAESLDGLRVGDVVEKGQEFCSLGHYPINGNWPPHLHFQLITDLLDMEGTFPGVAFPSQKDTWLSLSPSPLLMLDLPSASQFSPILSAENIQAQREKYLAPSLSLSYKNPLHIVRGWRQNLITDQGQSYLDCVNNVSHVGHCHPEVVKASATQMSLLNTNTRYLNRNITKYCRRLISTLPDPLSVCFLVNSGSEANELAFRMAHAKTGREDLIVVNGGYHGNTGATVAASSYKFEGPGGKGPSPSVFPVIAPDDYQGPFLRDDPKRGERYAHEVELALKASHDSGTGPSLFICESLLSCGGQIVLPPGYLKAAYKFVRKAGGICIADEVQVGFGRVGSHFWGFQTQDVVPDIVTMGKPMGNGHPMGAVVTTPEIAQAFNNGMEYFNTFGGNPVSCSIGIAVLDIIEQANLQAHALEIGNYLLAQLSNLLTRHEQIGDIRGLGLFIGIEIVSNKQEKAPRRDLAKYIVERMKDHGILLSTDGPKGNVIKIKPPLVFDKTDATRLIRALERILLEDFVVT